MIPACEAIELMHGICVPSISSQASSLKICGQLLSVDQFYVSYIYFCNRHLLQIIEARLPS
jgi:hypothetical protein